MLFDEFLIRSNIHTVADWPCAGVIFRDISPLLRHPRAARMVTDTLIQRYVEADITHVGAVDSQGFLLGSILAYALNKPLILLRKAGHLPGKVNALSYESNFGSGRMEVHSDAFDQHSRVLLVDDLIASGHTLLTAAELVRQQGGRVHEAAVIVDLSGEGGSDALRNAGIPMFSLCTF
jgi:adenine phosphoribosyltransferase